MVSLSILDYAQIDEGQTPQDALQQTLALAQASEAAGFKRFWVAEHHNVPAFASSTPEVLISQLLNATQTIRIGSGGVMLPHYAPLKVAENFNMLSAFHPNRVDLGVGNSPGTVKVQRAMGTDKKTPFSYVSHIQALQDYLMPSSDNHSSAVMAHPINQEVPEMWVLSSSVKSARMAAEKGVGYVFGLFPYASEDKLEVAKEACRVYRESFKPSAFLKEPCVSVAPFLTVAPEETEALAYAEALDVWLLGKNNFEEFQQFPSVETARNYTYTQADREVIKRNRSRMVVGGIDSVAQQLNDIVTLTQADELLLIPLMPNIEARLQAVKLLGKALA